MSENLHDLCVVLVEDFLGDFHAQLFSQLVYYGRLSAPQIAQKSHLPLRQVKIGLATLIQLQLVHHHTTLEGLSNYQANISAAYNTSRIGKLVSLAEQQHGKLAGLIISEAYYLGFCSVAELEHKALLTSSGTQASSENGIHQSEGQKAVTPDEVRTMTSLLFAAGYMNYVRSAHFQTKHDATHDAESSLRSKKQLDVPKGKKGQIELDARIDAEVMRRTDSGTMEYGHVPDISSTKKRSLADTDDQPSSKRQKVNGETSSKVNGYSSPAMSDNFLNPAALICVNFNNLICYTRNTYLAARANKLLNATYSRVFVAALSQVPSASHHLRSPPTNQIDVRELKDEVNHSRPTPQTNGRLQNGNAKVNGTVMHDDDDESETLRVSYNEVDRAMAILADSEFRFLNGAYGKDWIIDNASMKQYIQQHEIARLMGDGLASPALRIVRMLISKGKLDEKTLQEVGLLSAKDLRQTLGLLKRRGYIDLQEVPREAQRQPNRTIYLWFHDPERVQKVLLNNLYKAMVRLLQRLKLERTKMSSTLEKTERTDVQGREEILLPMVEANLLKRWRRLEQWIWGEIGRLDESVILLRDM